MQNKRVGDTELWERARWEISKVFCVLILYNYDLFLS